MNIHEARAEKHKKQSELNSRDNILLSFKFGLINICHLHYET